jgi:hypothetical protein
MMLRIAASHVLLENTLSLMAHIIQEVAHHVLLDNLSTLKELLIVLNVKPGLIVPLTERSASSVKRVSIC